MSLLSFDWAALEFTDSLTNHKTGKPYSQRYLTPALYVELYVRWTPVDALMEFYSAATKRLSTRLSFHQTDRMNRPSRIRDVEAAFNYFPAFLASRRPHAWMRLSDVDGVGSDKHLGGVGPCRFEAWIRHADPSTAARQLAAYIEHLRHWGTDMLPMGVPVSRVEVCFPVDEFDSWDAFRSWVLERELVSEGRFFSGSAGLKVLAFEGYDNTHARTRLQSILHEFPGFDFNPGIGNSLGRVLSADRTTIVPTVKRVNWLTLVCEEGVGLLSAPTLAPRDHVTVHRLSHALCLQAGETPSLLRDAPELRAYFTVSDLLRPLLYRPHPRDHYTLPNDTDAKTWLYHFHEPVALAGPTR